MDKMLTIGVKKGVFSYEDVFNLIYGELIINEKETIWHPRDKFRLIPVSYRKELIKKLSASKSDVLTEAVRALLEDWVVLREVNPATHWVNLLDEIALWIEWGVCLNLTLSQIKSGIMRHIGYIATMVPYPDSPAKLLEAFGMPSNEAKSEIEKAIYYEMMA